MRTLQIITACTFLLYSSVPATAQTPDGLTPAAEDDCDVLIGTTPGLYGLCVAYCEAHDAHILSPSGDPAELDVPNIQILNNYNKIKSDLDRPMPCVQQGGEPQDGCPCWTTAQLSTVMPPSTNFDAGYPNACLNDTSDTSLVVLENFENGIDVDPRIRLLASNPAFEEYCEVDNYGYPEGPPHNLLRVTVEEFEACRSLLVAHANTFMSEGMYWDCFTE